MKLEDRDKEYLNKICNDMNLDGIGDMAMNIFGAVVRNITVYDGDANKCSQGLIKLLVLTYIYNIDSKPTKVYLSENAYLDICESNYFNLFKHHEKDIEHSKEMGYELDCKYTPEELQEIYLGLEYIFVDGFDERDSSNQLYSDYMNKFWYNPNSSNNTNFVIMSNEDNSECMIGCYPDGEKV